MDKTFWTAVQPLLAQGARDFLRTAGSALAAHGYITTGGAGVEAFIGAGMTLAGLFWGWWTTSGYLQAGALLKKLTASRTTAAAVEVAKVMPSAEQTGAADKAKAIVTAAAVVKVLLVAFALSFLVATGTAQAQLPFKPKTPGQIVRDIQNKVEGKPQQATDTSGNPIVSLLSKPMQDLADFISAGFTEAVSLSTAVPELQDGNGQACWAMMNNYSAVLKAHPIPLTLHAAADLESIRLLNMAANKICQNSACTQVFTDAGNLVNAALPIGMPLPNLTAICSKVPEIAIVSPTLPIVPLSPPVATPPAVNLTPPGVTPN